jgi:type I restriction enzyme S subunit
MAPALDRSTWSRVKFGDFAMSVSDRVDDPSSAGVDRYVGLEHLDPGSMTVNRWGSPAQVEASKLRFKSGDVIFGRRRAYQKKVARADFEGICSAHALVLRAKPGLIDPSFLPVFLSSEVFLNRAIQISVGSLSPTVNWKTLAIEEFDIPPLDQQRRIADLLWAIEREMGASEARNRSLRAVAELRADQLLEPKPGDTVQRCGDVCRQITVGIVVRPTQYYATTGVPALRSLNVLKNDFSLDNLVFFDPTSHATLTKTTLRLGDVVVVRTGRPGDAAVVDERVAGSNCIDLIIARPDHMLEPGFLMRYLNSRVGRAAILKHSAGTAQQHFNVGALSNLQIPMLSLEGQQTILEELEELDGAISKAEALAPTSQLLRSAIRETIWRAP